MVFTISSESATRLKPAVTSQTCLISDCFPGLRLAQARRLV